jgi:hypothetical protein
MQTEILTAEEITSTVREILERVRLNNDAALWASLVPYILEALQMSDVPETLQICRDAIRAGDQERALRALDAITRWMETWSRTPERSDPGLQRAPTRPPQSSWTAGSCCLPWAFASSRA